MIDQCSNSYEVSMRISERGQLTIPKELRDRFGMNKDVEVEITAYRVWSAHSKTDGGQASGREGQWDT